MNFLFFDTETTGLPRNYKAHFSEIENWPRIVQLSWLLADEQGHVIKESDNIIKVDFQIPAQASQIHGITNAVADSKGRPMFEVLKDFCKDLEGADHLVGHNVSFDLPILQCELFRADFEAQIPLTTFCTMKKSVDYCQLPGPYGFKWPKLEELYTKCFQLPLHNAHNAMADVKATYEIFYHLKKEKVFQL